MSKSQSATKFDYEIGLVKKMYLNINLTNANFANNKKKLKLQWVSFRKHQWPEAVFLVVSSLDLSRGHIFSPLQSFYEWAVSNLDSQRSMHKPVLVAHSSFIEWSHMTKNTALGCSQLVHRRVAHDSKYSLYFKHVGASVPISWNSLSFLQSYLLIYLI
jgi:hypothetical protein